MVGRRRQFPQWQRFLRVIPHSQLRIPNSAFRIYYSFMIDWLLTAQVSPWMEAAPRAAFVIWFAYIGACIGSFLHVVYHRLPLGEDIVFQGSHCPECHAPIRWYHNLPIIGWLMLRGRCYDCKSSISIRYWLFEIAFTVVFAIPGYFFSGWIF